MMSIRRGLVVVLAVLAGGLLSVPAQAKDCDRACLGGLVTQYLDALVAHDPSKLPLAPGARFTENGQPQDLGKGVWQTVTGKATFRQDYLDTKAQVAAAHVELREGTVPVLYSLALHVVDGKIAGIETIVQRVTPDSRFQPTELGAPIRGMNDPVPAGQRQSRAAMIATALKYPEGLRVGNFTDAGTAFAPTAYRVENGVVTAGQGCGRADCSLYNQRLLLHPGVIPSVVAVDEENGTVLLWMNFGDTGSYGENRALVTFEGFKVSGGAIRAINAFFAFLPANTSRFWNSSDPVPARY
jgi:hypothetical protein